MGSFRIREGHSDLQVLLWRWNVCLPRVSKQYSLKQTRIFCKIENDYSNKVSNVRVPTFFVLSNSLIFTWFPKSFPWFFLSFHQDILVKKTYLFFLNVALVTLVYANIAISWQLLRFNSLKKHFPQIYRIKRFENGLEKKFPDFGWKTCFSLTGKSLQNFPWSVGTLNVTKLNIILLWGFTFVTANVSYNCDRIHGEINCVPFS